MLAQGLAAYKTLDGRIQSVLFDFRNHYKATLAVKRRYYFNLERSS
jgi:hypothetical protein